MRKKDIPTDQLLSILEMLPKGKKESKSPSAEEVKAYINFNNITAGEYWVPSFVIYNHYVTWAKGRKVFAERIFFRELHKYFERKKEFLYPFYKINLESLGLSYVDYENIMLEVKNAQKEANKRNSQRFNEKKNKKKQT